ncbi:neck protein [Vibrio phage 1.228.O._10N.261.49.C1]|nr:neck protein [Vibrio phage 1.228.O._10N.261.49.C1]
MSFADEWERESQRAIQAQKEVIKVISIELFSGTITSSPVGNTSLWKNPNSAPSGYTGGSFRSNWFLSYNAPSSETTESTERGKTLASSIAKEIEGGNYKGIYQLTNNLPYGPRLESGNWSQQAPNGIIAPNVMRVSSKIPAIEKIVNKKYGVD